jgi:peptidoglycan-associated lipoprotein
MRKFVIAFVLATAATAASAQFRLPVIIPLSRGPQQPVVQGIDALRADFAAQSGGTTVYFGGGSTILGPPARQVLAAQAAWLRRHPEVVVRVEGYGDAGDTRDHALAVGAARAEEARSYLVLLGVPAAQVSSTSWGKERPGLGRAVTVLVSLSGAPLVPGG